jgi:hypothetical protein
MFSSKMRTCSVMALYKLLLISYCLLAAAAACRGVPLRRGPPVGPYKYAKSSPSNELDRQLVKRCKLYFRNATLDHFSWVSTDVRISFRDIHWLDF